LFKDDWLFGLWKRVALTIRHHTKDKGDIGITQVSADLTLQGYQICLPISEHLPFDLIGVSPDGMLLRRVQAKYRSLTNGVLHVCTMAQGLDAHGPYSRSRDLSKIDAFAVYCPETRKVYYINVCELKGCETFSLRINPPANNQVKHVRFADNYLNAARIFTPL